MEENFLTLQISNELPVTPLALIVRIQATTASHVNSPKFYQAVHVSATLICHYRQMELVLVMGS